jgi:hypothetical protein
VVQRVGEAVYIYLRREVVELGPSEAFSLVAVVDKLCTPGCKAAISQQSINRSFPQVQYTQISADFLLARGALKNTKRPKHALLRSVNKKSIPGTFHLFIYI